jgi:3-dehydroquinate synthase
MSSTFEKIKIDLKSNPYNVIIGSGILQQFFHESRKLNLSSNLFAVTDYNVYKLHKEKIDLLLQDFQNKKSIHIVQSGEKSKSYYELNKIYKHLIDNNYHRDTLLIAIGGGVTGDLAAFAASTFMRGIQLVHIPTTLLAMADSSIGGKNGINFNKTKNIVGTFYQPEFVLIDTRFIGTLPEKELNSGAGEILKYAFLSDRKFYEFVSANLDKIFSFNDKIIRKIISESVKIKASVIAYDEKESGLRKILNFGHTFAHAFESELNYKISHGEAVAAGIISALFLSFKLNILKKGKLKEFIELPLKMKLPGSLLNINFDNIFSIMQKDKKNRSGKINLVLISDIGNILIDVSAKKTDIMYALNMMKAAIGSSSERGNYRALRAIKPDSLSVI